MEKGSEPSISLGVFFFFLEVDKDTGFYEQEEKRKSHFKKGYPIFIVSF